MAALRDVAIIAFSQTPLVRKEEAHNEVEMLMPIVVEVLGKAGLAHDEIGFVCSGSSDYLAGQAFSFVMTLDSVGPWPPISESHVDMDGAWALYEAWVKMQTGTVDTALVYSYGKSSPGDIRRVLTRQLDPYYLAPLWPDSVSIAALQARACLDAGVVTEADMAEVAARSRQAAASNPFAQLTSSAAADALLDEPMFVDPLRVHDCPPVTDGGAAIVLAAGDRARELCDRPAWIRGIDHRIEPHNLGKVDLAELHAPFTHQELVLSKALGLGDDTVVNPSGGALAANVVMAAGLIRLGEAATRVSAGEADRAVAHATSGPCLQQNLVCVLEGE
jgi:acetyl-CoA acetyltransferase